MWTSLAEGDESPYNMGHVQYLVPAARVYYTQASTYVLDHNPCLGYGCWSLWATVTIDGNQKSHFHATL